MSILPDVAISSGVAGAAGVLIAGAMQGPYKTLQDMWYCAIGYKWEFKAEEIRQRHLFNLQKMQQNIITGIEQINPDDIQEPQISILGPALEASRFYMDEDEIREMFAKLVVSSMDKSKNDSIHHAFVDIIKMLSPLDAKNLYYIHTLQDETITQIKKTISQDGSYYQLYNHVYLGNPENPNHAHMEASIDNLNRLGLIKVSYTEYQNDKTQYDKHKQHPLFLAEQKALDEHKESIRSDLEKLATAEPIKGPDGQILTQQERQQYQEVFQRELDNAIEIQQGLIQLTAFGRKFCKVCLPD